MGIVYGAIMPHPPIVLSEIGGDRLADAHATVSAMKEIGRNIKDRKPDVIVIFTPHGEVDYQKVNIYEAAKFSGSFANFGYHKLSYELPGDIKFTEKIIAELMKDKVPFEAISFSNLDHGVLVPLYFALGAGWKGTLVPMAIAVLPLPVLFNFGRSLGRALSKLRKSIVVIGSADMSHRLTQDAPAGYHPMGKEFDEKLVKLVEAGDVEGILHFDPGLSEIAGQDALWSTAMLLGCMDGLKTSNRVLSL